MLALTGEKERGKNLANFWMKENKNMVSTSFSNFITVKKLFENRRVAVQ